MTDVGSMSIEEALAHFGVMGMKWGVRRSTRGAGMSRYNSAKVQANTRDIKLRTNRINSKYVSRIPGVKPYNKLLIKELEKSNARIVKGKRKLIDLTDYYSRVGVTDLVFTKTPK